MFLFKPHLTTSCHDDALCKWFKNVKFWRHIWSNFVTSKFQSLKSSWKVLQSLCSQNLSYSAIPKSYLRVNEIKLITFGHCLVSIIFTTFVTPYSLTYFPPYRGGTSKLSRLATFTNSPQVYKLAPLQSRHINANLPQIYTRPTFSCNALWVSSLNEGSVLKQVAKL